MNLIECWNKAKDGQPIVNNDGLTFHKTNCESFLNVFKSAWMTQEQALADDWEIVKEKKKVVIEMEWEQCENTIEGQRGNTNIIHPVMHINSDIDNWRDLPKHKKMKMTLEWEE